MLQCRVGSINNVAALPNVAGLPSSVGISVNTNETNGKDLSGDCSKDVHHEIAQMEVNIVDSPGNLEISEKLSVAEVHATNVENLDSELKPIKDETEIVHSIDVVKSDNPQFTSEKSVEIDAETTPPNVTDSLDDMDDLAIYNFSDEYFEELYHALKCRINILSVFDFAHDFFNDSEMKNTEAANELWVDVFHFSEDFFGPSLQDKCHSDLRLSGVNFDQNNFEDAKNISQVGKSSKDNLLDNAFNFEESFFDTSIPSVPQIGIVDNSLNVVFDFSENFFDSDYTDNCLKLYCSDYGDQAMQPHDSSARKVSSDLPREENFLFNIQL